MDDTNNSPRFTLHCSHCMKMFNPSEETASTLLSDLAASEQHPKQLMPATTLQTSLPRSVEKVKVLQDATTEWHRRGIPTRPAEHGSDELEYRAVKRKLRELLFNDATKSNSNSNSNSMLSLSPGGIFEEMEKYVIGQEQVKKVLSVGLFNHYQRLKYHEKKTRVESLKKMKARLEEHKREEQNNGRNSATGDTDELEERRDQKWNQSYEQRNSIARSQMSPHGDPAHAAAEAAAAAAAAAASMEDEDAQNNTDFPFICDMDEEPYVELDKSNVLICGPTGSGKTLMAKTLARLANVPLVVVDATSLTQAGYVGEDVESILFKLYKESGDDLEKVKIFFVTVSSLSSLYNFCFAGECCCCRQWNNLFLTLVICCCCQ